MQSKIKLVSYCAGANAGNLIKKFKDFHSQKFSDVTVVDDTYTGMPLNSCKIKAAEFILSEVSGGRFGIYVLCDIDTRILRLRGLNSLILRYDAAFYFRHASPMHLSNLSGFIVLNITSRNLKVMKTFIENWVKQYENQPNDWYSDQRSLILSIYTSEISKELKYADLSKLKTKLYFNWGTTPNFFKDAITHKGNDRYFIFNVKYQLRWPALILDQGMLIINLAWRYLRRVLRLSHI